VQVEEIIESVDYDGSGDVCFDEFMDIILARDKESGENPIVKIYDALSKGTLGDQSLHMTSIITAYRRRLLMKVGQTNAKYHRTT
jgi:hypothetical protein